MHFNKDNVVVVEPRRYDAPNTSNCKKEVSIKHRHSIATTSKPLILREHTYNAGTNRNTVVVDVNSSGGSQRQQSSDAYSRRDTYYSVMKNEQSQNSTNVPGGTVREVVVDRSTGTVAPRRRRQYHTTELGENNDECHPRFHLNAQTSHANGQHVLQEVLPTTNPVLESHRNGSKKIKTESNHVMVKQDVNGNCRKFAAILHPSKDATPAISDNQLKYSVKQYYIDKSRAANRATFKQVNNNETAQLMNTTFTYAQVK